MHKIRIAYWLLVATLLLASCQNSPSQEDLTAPTVDATPLATVDSRPPSLATPIESVRPTVTPRPTEPAASRIDVQSQPVDNDGVVLIDFVYATEAAQLVLLDADDNLLASAPITAGANNDVLLTVDPFAATETVTAKLVADISAENEITDLDDPVEAEFGLILDVRYPSLRVSDQTVGDDEVVFIDSAEMVEPGWLVLYNDDNGPDDIVGLTYLPAGERQRIPLTVPWRDATPTLHVLLHSDNAPRQQFDPADDLPISLQQATLSATFTATYPPQVIVHDQPLAERTLTIARAVSYGPGWVAISSDENRDNFPDTVIGYAHLSDGVNEWVTVPLLATPDEERLYVQIHVDESPIRRFSYPNGDPIVAIEEQLRSTPFNLVDGSYLIARNQPLVDDTITVDVVVADQPVWVVARVSDGGEAGEVLGAVAVGAGVQADVSITLDEVPEAGELLVVLHANGGDIDSFEYPKREDEALQIDGNLLSIPVTILEE